MAPKKTATKEKTAEAPQQAQNAGAVVSAQPEAKGLRLRIPYPRAWCEHYNVTPGMWKVYIDAVWPAAKTVDAVCMAIAYCAWRKLDPVKKMVHIVPVWAKDGGGYDDNGKPIGGMIETVWPSIAEIRITATRTNAYAGKDAMEFGPMVENTFNGKVERWEGGKKVTVDSEPVTLTYPEWARLTVYKIVQGQICKFVGPQVKWEESYATEGRHSDIPNEMWRDRRQGQLEKCAEAAALRAAFPEELGNEYAAEEMYGRIVEHAPVRQIPEQPKGTVTPPSGGQNEFSRNTSDTAIQDPKTPVTLTDDGVQAKQETGHGEPAPETLQQMADKAWLQDQYKALAACAKVGQVGELSNVVEQDLPPDSKELTDWIAACKARCEAILAAGKQERGK